jgi:DNA repair exonuclease SbcCD nuclease subunit
MFNIGVLHTALEGNAAHANYAPCALEELHAKGYQYWALGHVHEYRVWEGRSAIVFPGNLQGRHIRETGPRGAVMVTVDEAGTVGIERVYVDVLRWHLLEVDASDCLSLHDVARAVGATLEDLAADPTGNSADIATAVRVVIRGKTPAHGELFGLEAQLRAEVLGFIAAIGHDRLWLEKVVINTMAINDRDALRARADALSDLQDMLDGAEADAAFLDSLRQELLLLVNKAPIELQAQIPYFAEIRAGNLTGLVEEVRPSLMAHLARVG